MKKNGVMKVAVMVSVLLLLFAAGCDSGEASDSEEEMIFEVIDRGADEVTAYVHVDHWHGELPGLPVGDTLSLGAYIENNGEEIELDGDYYSLDAKPVSGSGDLVDCDSCEDHVYVMGKEEGQADIVFLLLHDGEVEYESPPISVEIGQ